MTGEWAAIAVRANWDGRSANRSRPDVSGPGEDRRRSLFAVMTRRNGGAEGETRSRRHEKGAKGDEMIQMRESGVM